MVSLEAKSAYMAPLLESPMPHFFVGILYDQPDLQPPRLQLADSNSLACNVLHFVRHAEAVPCRELYQQLQGRKPNKESEWIYNDYLVFSLVCAVKKFALPSEWVRQLLSLRASHDEERQKLNATLRNILAGNLNNREDYHQVSLVYQVLTGEQVPDETRLNKMFKFLWRQPFPFFTSPFLNLISLKALELAFNSKGMLNPEQFFAAEQFTERFLLRTRRIAAFVVTVPVLALVVSLGVATVRYPENGWVKLALLLTSAFGVDVLGAFSGLRDKLRGIATGALRRALGYSPPSTGASRVEE
ncbi:hypothetical protein LGH70_22395 [Hymenobacter sp. BT635]|uniref:Uncharacterized protein n=1 Tax=Hymenobacter nitidus TaxID=2880929 RepID=A0ABS8ALH5_9BACT|nr:hypothetical protein [Hymenobacter nitidus]MCB2380359.1 hypothetical protein [Hymenobacter nitidus]